MIFGALSVLPRLNNFMATPLHMTLPFRSRSAGPRLGWRFGWLRGNAFNSINEVSLLYTLSYSLYAGPAGHRHIITVCNQPHRSTQPGHPSADKQLSTESTSESRSKKITRCISFISMISQSQLRANKTDIIAAHIGVLRAIHSRGAGNHLPKQVRKVLWTRKVAPSGKNLRR